MATRIQKISNLQSIEALERCIHGCTTCPRLRHYTRKVAVEKVKRHLDEKYWGRAVSGFGDPKAEAAIIGLAPAAHGANRTGRIFTGDDSGNWLFEALHRYGFANQPTSTHKDDGLQLSKVYVTQPVKCAPPGNKPSPDEYRNCQPFLEREIALLRELRAFVVLGRVAFDKLCRLRSWTGLEFKQGACYEPEQGMHLLVSFHPSRYNTATKRLTLESWHAVFEQLRTIIDTK